jgi:hypothetical protein
MQILLDVSNESASQKILDFLAKSFKKSDVTIKTIDDVNKSKENPFAEFAGLWENREIDIKSIRESAWKK